MSAPRGMPKPPPDIWHELEEAGREAGENFESDPRYMVAHARYVAWLTDHDIDERHAHGSERPDEAIR